MAEDQEKDPTQQETPKANDANDGGKQSGGEAVKGQETSKAEADDPRFTNEQVEAIVEQRLARERKKYADYADLQEQAKKWAEFEESQKSELEKAQEAAERAQRERDIALQNANDRLIRAAFMAEAGRIHAKHPEDAYLLSDLSNVVITEDGNVAGVSEAVEALVADGRLPTEGRPSAPKLDAGAGSGERTNERPVKLTDEELQIARKMGIPPEDYAKYKTMPA